MWDMAKLFSDLAVATKELQKPMTIEQAVDFLDPDPMRQKNLPDSIIAIRALDMKAKTMVVKYMRNNLQVQSNVGCVPREGASPEDKVVSNLPANDTLTEKLSV